MFNPSGEIIHTPATDEADFLKQQAVLADIQTEQIAELNRYGIVARARDALTTLWNHDFNDAHIQASVCTTDLLAQLGTTEEFGIRFDITRCKTNGDVHTNTLSCTMGERHPDNSVVITTREKLQGVFELTEVQLVYGMVERLRLERELGTMPSLNRILTGINGPL